MNNNHMNNGEKLIIFLCLKRGSEPANRQQPVLIPAATGLSNEAELINTT